MTTPQQHQEFEAALQQHIQQAVAAALAGMLQPAPPPPTVNVNAVAVKSQSFGQPTRRRIFTKQRPPSAAPTSPSHTRSTTTS
jgi:hypothetical protein